MDAQLRRGVLDVCVLRALCEGDSYGYRIVKDISPFVTISESTLYPILKRLESMGCLTVYSVEHSGRLRKYYAITEAGRERIRDFLTEWEEIMRAYAYIKEGGI
ncbi:MAG: PadR family transcriptional regulator [Oscillospiraceae bacterium]|nr:PadR family transcriptional regulator [Oscillospiraceae bacterium]MBQ1730547.1 PadR family transcriptional regulator [Oscillospiraceae bacterium]MBQ1767745.1 PadR family transcriptional regulator [Oscillospiraceae bacterium]MBQ2057331.1 PadR family transcriptional regulator [Oscillospiraceae bacterium]MBQ2157643.1 PadR family transcriptional regulator [Oscillospiraceae bacterium]